MKFSKFISIIFHPIFIPTMVLSIIIYEVPEILSYQEKSLFFLINVLVFGTIVLPIISILILVNRGKIDSIEVTNHKQRKFILLPVFLFFVLSFLTMQCFFPGLYQIKKIYIGACILSLLCCFISNNWKISLHTVGSGSALGVLFSLQLVYGELLFWVISFILISLLVGYSRIKELAHNFNQVLIGFLTGFIIEFCCVFYL